MLGLHAEEVARYESCLQTHMEHKYTGKKKNYPGVVLVELCRKVTVHLVKGILCPVAREYILTMSTIGTAYRVL